jgi:uncharacterized cysteine cluster protein YcgN (CxxCxxCC family)
MDTLEFLIHEAKCQRCAKCCYHPTLKEPCPYLKGNECSVYNTRFEVRWQDSKGGNHKCNTIEKMIELNALPDTCVYRKENNDRTE